MPELPEVETTRRGLIGALEGRRITRAEVGHPRMLRRQDNPADFAARLEGRRVLSLGRVGKFLMFDVEGHFTWVTHLGMSGRMSLNHPDDHRVTHTHVVVSTDAGAEVRMVDPRTFGFTVVYTPEELADSTLARLGPDALTSLPQTPGMVAAAHGRSVAIKTLLLDQRFIAGLGNIYADEVLFDARIEGTRPASSITRNEMKAIRGAIGPVLRAGLKFGGTSLNDLAYLLPDGRAGEYVKRLNVYGREEEPCRRCGAAIQRQVIGGRSSFSCPRCQH